MRIGMWFNIIIRAKWGSTVQPGASVRERRQGLRLTGGDDQGPQDMPERQARAGDGLPNGHLHVSHTARK